MLQRLVIASNNTAKSKEIIDILTVLGVGAVNYRELIAQVSFPAETTDNMRENALVKATFLHKKLPNEYILADDSALFIPAIPDHFGVTTMHEFIAQGLHEDAEINDYVLGLIPAEADRTAWISSYLELVTPQGTRFMTEGRTGTRVAKAPRGSALGLDNIMETEIGLTTAEIAMPARINYLARGRAIMKMLVTLRTANEWQGQLPIEK